MTLEESDQEAEAVAVGPRVKLEDIVAQIDAKIFSLGDALIAEGDEVPGPLQRLTICVLIMRNGFTFVGTSSCVHPENFDAALGERLAYEKAINQAWSHEGYLLQDKLFRESGGEAF